MSPSRARDGRINGWLLLASGCTGLAGRLPRWALASVLAPGLATIAIAFTNGTLHGWLWSAARIAEGSRRLTPAPSGATPQP